MVTCFQSHVWSGPKSRTQILPCCSKICDWLLYLSQDHFGLHQAKNVKLTMELEVLKRLIFRATLSIVMVQQVL